MILPAVSRDTTRWTTTLRTDVTAFTFLLFLVWLVAYGAGKLSLDSLLRKVFSLEPEPLTGNSSTVAESV